MRTALDKLAGGGQMAQGASLLGKKVTGNLPPTFDAYGNPVAGKAISGVVGGVAVRGGQAFLRIGNEELPLSAATTVETAS